MTKNADAKAVIPPISGSVYLDLATADWQPDGDKFWIKPLYENPARGERTCLMKIDPMKKWSRFMCSRGHSTIRTARFEPATTPAGRRAPCTPPAAPRARWFC